ncbi:MAG: AbrB/MazE/SpoVT family DNA-binding domain-containing protein [Holophagales bacterium]|nr:AbrB/MazE/SpoVT family DNA-binding domain-containing protein [Holophagales bacterium]
MRITMDVAGRIVIPKPLRLRLHLVAGEPLVLRERDGRLEIEPAPTPMSLEARKGGVVAVPRDPLPVLTDEIVRETLERSRR